MKLQEEEKLQIACPAHLVLYEDEGIELTDHYEVTGNFPMYEGNLLLVDEQDRIYTCLYLRQGEGGNFFLLKGLTFLFIRRKTISSRFCISGGRRFPNFYMICITGSRAPFPAGSDVSEPRF